MAENLRSFRYLAFDATGRRIKGVVAAHSDARAFEHLKREGLSPIRLTPAGNRQPSTARARGLSDRDLAAFLADLGALLRAGADMRAGLAILGARSGKPMARTLSRSLSQGISGGAALDEALLRCLGRDRAFIAALVAAGVAGGTIATGFERAAEMLEARVRFADQMVSVLSYPAFVLASTLVALGVILLFVVPSLAPLVQEAGGAPPAALGAMITVSGFLTQHLPVLGVMAAAAALTLIMAWRLGALATPMERLMLDGPARRTAGALIYGGFAIALGTMLAAGAPMGDSLRLSIRSVRTATARARLERVGQAVRQGDSLPTAFERIVGFPSAIVRLAAVGEVSGGLGAMLARAGKLEEDAAIRRIDAIGRLLGPALIIVLGGVIGLMMAGLLSGVSQLGDAALK